MLTLFHFGAIIPVSTNRKLKMSIISIDTKIPVLTELLDKDLLKLKDEFIEIIRSSKNSTTPEHVGANFLNNYDLINGEIRNRVEKLEKKYESMSEEELEKLRDEADKDWETNYIELCALHFSPGLF